MVVNFYKEVWSGIYFMRLGDNPTDVKVSFLDLANIYSKKLIDYPTQISISTSPSDNEDGRLIGLSDDEKTLVSLIAELHNSRFE